VVGHTYAFSSSLLNEFRVGYNRFKNFHTGIDFGVDENNALGLANGNLSAFRTTSGIANFSVSGLVATSGPGSSNGLRLTNSYQITDGLTWVKGGHTIKFGEDIIRFDITVTNPESNSRGTYDFSNGFTSTSINKKTIGGASWA